MMDPSDTKNDGRLFGNIVYEGIRPSITDDDFEPPQQVASPNSPIPPPVPHSSQAESGAYQSLIFMKVRTFASPLAPSPRYRSEYAKQEYEGAETMETEPLDAEATLRLHNRLMEQARPCDAFKQQQQQQQQIQRLRKWPHHQNRCN